MGISWDFKVSIGKLGSHSWEFLGKFWEQFWERFFGKNLFLDFRLDGYFLGFQGFNR